MKNLLPIFLTLFLTGCVQSENVSKDEVMDTLNEFFYLLDNDVDKIREYLSEDFLIYELSRKWNTD